jgi:histone H3/H4
MLFAACAESSAFTRTAIARTAQQSRVGVPNMGAKKKAAKKGGDSMIISKSRVKVAATKSNVGSEFYGALEAHVRELIANAEKRAAANGRKTLRPQDV